MHHGHVSKILNRIYHPAERKQMGKSHLTSKRYYLFLLNLQNNFFLIIRVAKKNPLLSFAEILNEVPDINISSRSVHRRLVNVGLRARRPARKPFIARNNKAKRLEFTKCHLDWTVDEGKKV